MSVSIAGMGWVTPLGTELDVVWEQIARGAAPVLKTIANPETGREHLCAPVPPSLTEALNRNPRLRRSSPISYFAVAAGLAALADAGLTMTPELAARTAVVFAIGNGGVIYTRRFYEQIVKQGANTASPLLFPETVYNAPASHLAAQLGIDGASYTLVGDQSVGLAALKMAEQLIEIGAADRCVVVGCEELDWILCEGYRDWRLAATPAHPDRGAILAEGAGALVLAREGRCELRAIHDGVPFFHRAEAGAALERAVADVTDGAVDLVVSCGNRTFIERIEAEVLARHCADAPVYYPKRSLGEAPGASALLQVIAAAQALERTGGHCALVPVLGFNQQASAAVLSRG